MVAPFEMRQVDKILSFVLVRIRRSGVHCLSFQLLFHGNCPLTIHSVIPLVRPDEIEAVTDPTLLHTGKDREIWLTLAEGGSYRTSPVSFILHA